MGNILLDGLVASSGGSDEKVKASSSDTTAGYLDAKVDASTIEVSGNKLQVVSGVFADVSHTHTASDVTDFDAEVSNNTDVAANTSHRNTTTGNPHDVDFLDLSDTPSGYSGNANYILTVNTDENAVEFKEHNNWIAESHTVTKVDADTFTIDDGDYTDIYVSGLAIQADLTTVTVYSYVESASYDSGTNKTTVNLYNSILDDGGALAHIYYSVNTPRNSPRIFDGSGVGVEVGSSDGTQTVYAKTDDTTITTSGGYLKVVDGVYVEKAAPQLDGELDCQAHSIGFTLQTYTGNGTTTIDWRNGNKAKFTFGAQNETLSFTAPSKPCALQLIVVQDSAGSRTITWPTTVKWAGGSAPTLTTTANAVDVINFLYDGTNYYGVASLNFS